MGPIVGIDLGTTNSLAAYMKDGRPVIDGILNNYYLNFSSWVVRKSIAFQPAGILRYDGWKTTEARLFESGAYANAALDIEPAVRPDRYNAIIRTTRKTNTKTDVLFGLIKGAPIRTSFFDLWSIGNSGVNFGSTYRWDSSRRRAASRSRPNDNISTSKLTFWSTWVKRAPS